MIFQTGTSKMTSGLEQSQKASSGDQSAASRFQEIFQSIFSDSASSISVFPFSSPLGPKRIESTERVSEEVKVSKEPAAAKLSEAPSPEADLLSKAKDLLPSRDQGTPAIEQAASEIAASKPAAAPVPKTEHSNVAQAQVGQEHAESSAATVESAAIRSVQTQQAGQKSATMQNGVTKAAHADTNVSPELASPNESISAPTAQNVGSASSETAAAKAIKTTSQTDQAASEVSEEAAPVGAQDVNLKPAAVETKSNSNAALQGVIRTAAENAAKSGAGARVAADHIHSTSAPVEQSGMKIDRPAAASILGGAGNNIKEKLAAKEGSQAGKAAVANQARFVEQVQKALDAASRSNDGNTLILKLDPLEMGAVALKVTKRGDQIFARVNAENPEVEAILRGQIQGIVHSLQSAGFKPENIHVSFGAEQSEQSWAAFRQHSSNHPRSGGEHENSSQYRAEQLSKQGSSNGLGIGQDASHVNRGSVESGWVA